MDNIALSRNYSDHTVFINRLRSLDTWLDNKTHFDEYSSIIVGGGVAINCTI